MSAQIIKRHEGFESQKEIIGGKPQVSFNDYGHMAVRFIQGNSQDTLIVFDANTSARIANFCQDRLKPIGKPFNSTSDEEVPF